MSILTAIGVSLISLAIAGYLVSLLRPAHRPAHRPDRDEHEDL